MKTNIILTGSPAPQWTDLERVKPGRPGQVKTGPSGCGCGSSQNSPYDLTGFYQPTVALRSPALQLCGVLSFTFQPSVTASSAPPRLRQLSIVWSSGERESEGRRRINTVLLCYSGVPWDHLTRLVGPGWLCVNVSVMPSLSLSWLQCASGARQRAGAQP